MRSSRAVSGPADTPSPKQLRAWLTILTVANFVIVTTEFVTVGLTPRLMRDLEISAARTGSLISVFALSAAIFGPILTIALRRTERRILLAAVVAVFSALNLVIAAVPVFWTVALARMVQGGLLPVFISAASVVAADLAGAKHAGKAVAVLNYGVAAATVGGIPLATLLADKVGWPSVFVCMGSLGLTAAILLFSAVPELRRQEPPSIGAQLALIRQPVFIAHLLLSMATFTAMFAGYAYLGVLLHNSAGFEGNALSAALFGFGAAGILGNWIAAQAVDRGPLAACAINIAALGIAMTFTAALPSKPLQAIACLAWGVFHMASFVFSQVRVLEAGKAAPTFAAALNISVCNAGIALGATFGGAVTEQFDARAAAFAGAAISVLATIIALALLLARDRKPSAV